MAQAVQPATAAARERHAAELQRWLAARHCSLTTCSPESLLAYVTMHWLPKHTGSELPTGERVAAPSSLANMLSHLSSHFVHSSPAMAPPAISQGVRPRPVDVFMMPCSVMRTDLAILRVAKYELVELGSLLSQKKTQSRPLLTNALAVAAPQMDPVQLQILRVAMYELIELGSLAHIVDEHVELVKVLVFLQAAGFTNGTNI